MKWRTLLAVLVMLAVFVPSVVMAEVTEEWVAIFDGGGYNPQDMAVDSSGNAYVVGGTELLKYGSDGELLWVKQHVGQGKCTDVKVDSTEGVYVTCNIYYNYARSYLLIKYAADGTELWSNTLDGAIYRRMLGVDQADNAYAVVKLPNNDGVSTIKYDKNGNKLWATIYEESSDTLWKYPTTMVVDDSGNVSVAGYSIGTDMVKALFLVKHDTDGNELWLRTDGTIGYTTDIAVDASGNVYIAADGSSASRLIVKYDANGNELWRQGKDGVRYNGQDVLAVDASGNAHIALSGLNSGTYLTVKYDTDGNELWSSSYTNVHSTSAVAVDSSGNVYVTGGSGGAAGDINTIKYGSNGEELWVESYTYDNNSWEYPTTIKTDDSGNVYVTAQTIGNHINDGYAYVTIKYSQGPSSIADIIDIINDATTNSGVANALTQLLTNAQAGIDSANAVGAINMLEAAINLIEAQSGNKIDSATAADLIGYLNDIISAI